MNRRCQCINGCRASGSGLIPSRPRDAARSIIALGSGWASIG